ncbi:hypothetical protein G6011_10591 [Alternaria panax]|uniref:N-acetyltransferase domain-containing protein n=1 Tax=Alternaria panax TaxID=48097 RepID=A0AAD4NQA5_9PLEO|nr:hypothetical protein G6011_10591 [Alternaria panax]
MTVSIAPALPDDAPHIAALHVQAFSSNVLMRAIYPTPAIWTAFQNSVEEKFTADMRDPNMTVLVARYVDEAETRKQERGVVVGYAVWCHPVRAGEEGWKPPAWKLPDGTDWSVLRPWLAAAAKVAHEVIGERPHYDLMWLAVSSDYARQGIGTLLLHWGLDLCEKEGVPACLDSTVEAAGTFYQKAGFTERGRIRLLVSGDMYEEVACVYAPRGQTLAAMIE